MRKAGQGRWHQGIGSFSESLLKVTQGLGVVGGGMGGSEGGDARKSRVLVRRGQKKGGS